MHFRTPYAVIGITSKLMGQLEDFFERFKPLRFRKREIILGAEEEPDGVFFIKSGYVRSFSISEEGREFTLNIYKVGTYFPATWALAGVPNTYFFEAMTPVELIKAPKEELLGFLRANPEILMDLTTRLLVGLNGLLVRIEHLLSKDAYHKVASAVFLAGRRFGKKDAKGKVIVELSLTHQDIADLSYLTRETTSLEMKKLEKRGLVGKRKRKLIIKDMKKLRQESLLFLRGKALPYTF